MIDPQLLLVDEGTLVRVDQIAAVQRAGFDLIDGEAVELVRIVLTGGNELIVPADPAELVEELLQREADSKW